MSNIGILLKKYRIEHNYSQKYLSGKLGVTQTYLSAIENGKRTPTKKFIKNLVSNFGFDENELSCIYEAFMRDTKTITISLDSCSKEAKELALLFAKKFSNITANKINKIIESLGETK